MKWFYLFIAVVGEVLATSALKESEGFTKMFPNQKLDTPAIIGIFLITIGVMIINLYSESVAH